MLLCLRCPCLSLLLLSGIFVPPDVTAPETTCVLMMLYVVGLFHLSVHVALFLLLYSVYPYGVIQINEL